MMTKRLIQWLACTGDADKEAFNAGQWWKPTFRNSLFSGIPYASILMIDYLWSNHQSLYRVHSLIVFGELFVVGAMFGIYATILSRYVTFKEKNNILRQVMFQTWGNATIFYIGVLVMHHINPKSQASTEVLPYLLSLVIATLIVGIFFLTPKGRKMIKAATLVDER